MNIIKFFIVGERGVGKSTLIDTYLWKEYFGYAYHDHVKEARRYHIQFVEISQFNELENVVKQNLCDIAIFLLCFQVDNRKSLRAALGKWIPSIRGIDKKANIFLTALQCDLRKHLKQKILRKCIRRSEGRKLCHSSQNLHYLECSSLQVTSVKDIFDDALEIVLYGEKEPEIRKDNLFKRICNALTSKINLLKMERKKEENTIMDIYIVYNKNAVQMAILRCTTPTARMSLGNYIWPHINREKKKCFSSPEKGHTNIYPIYTEYP